MDEASVRNYHFLLLGPDKFAVFSRAITFINVSITNRILCTYDKPVKHEDHHSTTDPTIIASGEE